MEESASAEIQEEANASNGNEHHDRVLANDIRKMIRGSEPPLSRNCCIYRVPHDLRKLNEEPYTPQFISIGPFHHGDERSKTMENLKVRYFERFLQKAAQNVENLVSYIRGREGDVRRCYAETSRLSSDNYVKMILLDASFIIVFFLIIGLDAWSVDYGNQLQINFTTVLKDMWLLENQLHFFVIVELYNLAYPPCSDLPSFTELTFKFFQDYNTQKISPNPDLEIIHFLDLLRTFFLPPSHSTISQWKRERNRAGGVAHFYTASQLDEAGVKFKVSSSEWLFDLKFTNGVLEIPRIKLYNETESLIRNLLALEQCRYLFDACVTDYIRVLDFLIDTTKDVDLLVRKGILVNGLGDSKAVATLVNNLCTHIAYLNINIYYDRLCEDLNRFYGNPRHSWEAILRRDYFSNPWRIASTVAAIILLVLTLIQTICSVISLQ